MKIDTTKIENFEQLSDSDKIKALTEFDFEVPKDNTDELNKQKKLNSDYASQISQLKKELSAKMTDDEKKAQEQKALLDELEALKKKDKVNDLRNQFSAQGYDAETAGKLSQALADNDSNAFITANMAFMEKKMKEMEEKSLNRQPELSKGKPLSKEQTELDKMTDAEYYEAIMKK